MAAPRPVSYGYLLASMTTLPPLSTSTFRVCPSSSSIPHERGAARRVGLDMPRLTVPQNRNVVNVEAHFIIVGQKCPSYVSKWQPQLSH